MDLHRWWPSRGMIFGGTASYLYIKKKKPKLCDMAIYNILSCLSFVALNLARMILPNIRPGSDNITPQ